ncbi:CapA family protein [Tsuneonella dongtanensis]|nr:CapA family protein [Tsuneonella dongtanensis]
MTPNISIGAAGRIFLAVLLVGAPGHLVDHPAGAAPGGTDPFDPLATPAAREAAKLHNADGRYDRVIVDPQRDLQLTIRGDFTIAAVGDMVAARPTAKLADPAVQRIYDVIRTADVGFGNLEMSIMDPVEAGGRQDRPHYFMALAAPFIADDLKEIGIDLVNRANNHTTTFGVESMHTTTAELDRVGIVGAGAGDNQALASRAGYLETPKGRIAIVGITTNSWLDARPAGDVSGGSPGANAMHVDRTVTITRESYDALVRAYDASPWMFPDVFAIRSGKNATFRETGGRLTLYNNSYVVGEQPKFSYAIKAGELDRFTREVRDAKFNSDFVVATIHAHQWDVPPDAKDAGQESVRPPDFLVTLARAAIDNGADAFYSHGEGELRGIEIYRGRPIFYQLGNFIRQPFLPQTWEDALWANTSRLPGYEDGQRDTVTKAEVSGGTYPTNHGRDYFESIVAVSRYRAGKLVEIRIHPVDMRFDGPFHDIGIPHYATGEVASRILEHVRKASAELGTDMRISNGIGIIEVGGS